MKKAFIVFIFFLCFGWVLPINSQSMSGGDFEIISDSFSFVNVNDIEGGNYVLQSHGESVSTTSTEGNNYVLQGGFLSAESGTISLAVNSNTVNLGELTTGVIGTGSVTVTVTTDSGTGYTVSIDEDGQLRTSDGANDIDDVVDGEVTPGQEEYGIQSSGLDALLSGDTAISGSVNIASNNGPVTNRSTVITFRASRGSGTAAGVYSHNVTFTATVNP